MAHPAEPMDTDEMSEFDNKENSIHHSNVLPPSTEKGYEELDVSELNMKLRYSFTPVTSPMSKSYTANCLDNRSQDPEDLSNTVVNENGNLTRSANSTVVSQNDSIKTPKSLPLQSLPLDGTVTLDNPNVTVTITATNDNDANVSFPSSSSSLTDTPEAASPVTEIPKPSGSPILRGLKSVLSMFRPSQSPIPPDERPGGEEVSSPPVVISPVSNEDINSRPETMLSSTPLTTNKRDGNKRGSPLKESLVFNDDLEKELAWNDETTIIFSKEKIPIHKLFYQQPNQAKPSTTLNKTTGNTDATFQGNLDTSTEPMDISYNNSTIKDHTMTEAQMNNLSKVDERDITIGNTEKDESVFLDCETTFSMDISQALDATIEHIDTEKPVGDNKLEFVRTDLDESLESQVAKQDETNMSMFSAEFQPELEEIEINKAINNKEPITDDNVIKFADFNPNTPTADYLAPLPENVHVIKPTSAPQNEIINAITGQVHKDGDDVLDSEEVPESIQKTLDETLFRMDGTQCFDDTVDVISRIEAAIRQQDDEFLDAPTNFENNDFETTLANLVNNISAKDTTQITDQSVDITVKDLEAVDISKPDITYVAQNVPLPSESDDSQDENSATMSAENKLNTEENAVVPQAASTETNTNAFKTEPIIEAILTKVEQIANTTAQMEPVTSGNNISQTFKSECEVEEVPPDTKKRDDTVVPSIDHNQPMVSTVQETSVVEVVQTKIDELSPSKSAATNGTQAQHTNEIALAQNIKENTQLESLVMEQTKIYEESPLQCTAASEIQDPHTTEIALAENIKEETQIESLDLKVGQVDNPLETTTVTQIKDIDQTVEQTFETAKAEIQEPHTNETALAENIKEETQIEYLDVKVGQVLVNNPLDTTTVTQIKEIYQTFETEAQQTKVKAKDIYLVEDNITLEQKELTEKLNTTTTIEQTQPNITLPQEASEQQDLEIVASESNSPFVSLSTEGEDFADAKRPDSVQDIEVLPGPTESEPVQNIPKSMTVSPPLSPKLPGKGAYNFNFDEMDDPFAIKSKVRSSPPPDDFDKAFEAVDKANVSLNKTAYKTPAKSSETKAISKTRNASATADSTVCLDTTVNQSSSNELPFNTTIDVTSVKTDLTFDFNKLNMTNRADDDLQSDLPVANDILSIVIDKTFNTEEIKILDEVNGAGKPEDIDADEVYEEAKDDTSEKEQESLDDFAMEENKISAELNGTLKEKTKSSSSSELSTYLSAATSSSEGFEQKLTENFEEANFNPFATKSKIRQSPPPNSNEENPFATRSKIASSPVTSFIATEEQNIEAKIAIETASLEAKIASQEAELANDNKSMDDQLTSDLDDCKDGSGTTCSESSRASDEKDITIKEVLTEDEDTMEGPFIDAHLGNDDGKLKKTFDDAAKITLDDVDMNHFTDLLAQPNEENFEAGEMFIDADAFEFLMNQNKSNELDENGKESLFLKFDPLFAKRVNSDGIVDALAKLQKRQSTPKKIKPVPRDLMSHQSPVAGPSNADVSLDDSREDVNATMSQKPTMVVPPAVNPIPSPRKATTPTRANRLSMNFTSPAMAVIDRLLSMSANNSLVGQDTPAQVSREYSEADRALTQFRELLAEKELNVHQLRCESKDLREKLGAMESQMSSLESESEKRLKNIEELNKKLDEKDKMNKNMASVVEEYERTIAGLIAGIEEDKKAHAEERMQLIKERDEQSAHLASMEVAFNDLHSKYEKSKQIIFSYKAKEDIYKKSIHEFEENLIKMEKNYESLKQHATSKLNFANQELEKINKSHDSEVLKLNAMMKRKDMHISSLEETLAQKSKANEELTAICDELINKVG